MRRAPLGLALVFALVLAACGQAQEASEPAATTSPSPSATASPLPSTSPSASPTGRDYTPPVLTPEAEKSETGARSLLLAWADAMEDREYGPAYALFGQYASRTGQSAAQYAASFADYRTVTVSVGEGMAEGACGSLYYEVPVTLSGTTDAGKPYVRDGTMTLRRVNDVDGATAAQLRWHLDRLVWSD
jgi:hypothetical protein